jgi:uncharacterized protein (DUF1697 family)
MTPMPSYVVFLRAINLGAKRKFPKDDIKAAVEAAGCTDVETYINTGNVRVTSGKRTRRSLEEALERAFLADRGFEVPTIAFTPDELAAVLADADELAAGVPVAMQYVSLLKESASDDVALALEAQGGAGEHAWVRDRAVHIVLERHDGYHQATMTNALVEKRLGVATNRNLKVIREVVSRWC